MGWTTPGRGLRFTWRVLKRFAANRGLLLASAVGYNMLLSLIPLLAVVLVALTNLLEPDELLAFVDAELHQLLPVHSPALLDALRSFLAARRLVGWVGFLILLFFSSLAFRILEGAIATIFEREREPTLRHPALSLLLPYAYVAAIGLAILALTVVMGALEVRPGSLAPRVAGFVGLVLLLASFYRVMPRMHVRFRLALVGGTVAAVLWEIVRAVLVYYFSHLSLVNVVYGSLATVIVVLLSMEIAAIIILLGAQVIAEIERSAAAGVPWHELPQPILPVRAPAPTSDDATSDPVAGRSRDPSPP